MGKISLRYAARERHADIVVLLIENSVNSTATDKDGRIDLDAVTGRDNLRTCSNCDQRLKVQQYLRKIYCSASRSSEGPASSHPTAHRIGLSCEMRDLKEQTLLHSPAENGYVEII